MSVRKKFTIVLLLLASFVAFLVTGALAPIAYEDSKQESFTDRPIEIWANAADIELIPRRRPEVESIVILFVGERGEVTWRENLKNGSTRMKRILSRSAPNYLSVEQFESSYGITGTWEFVLQQVGDATVVTINEKSTNMNLWLRAYYTIIGRNILIDREFKSLRVSLFQRLLTTD